jgi:DNA-binding transcriptional MocR family regulator
MGKAAINWDERYAARARRMAASEIRELLKLLDQPDIISFAGGIPDPALFPCEALAAAHQRILGDPARARLALQYSPSEGYPPLREWIASYMGSLGVACAADNVLITSGSQQGLDFLGKLFIAPGDTVLVARPTYLGALQAMSPYEPRFAKLPRRGDNLAPTGNGPADGGRATLAYVMPDFQNPTGLSLSRSEREDILAATDDVPIIEDAAYEALRYEGAREPSLLALDAGEHGGVDAARVLYSGTFSKTVVPGLRLGWTVAPKPVVRRLVLIKQASDLHTATLSQTVMHEVVSEVLPEHVGPIKAAYRVRRDAMLSALERDMPSGVTWTKPQGGMFIWVTLPESIDAAKLLERAIKEARVAFVPGRAFHFDGTGANTLRLSFSLADEAKIAEGIGRLAEVVRGACAASTVN